jgi:hypothetical protein
MSRYFNCWRQRYECEMNECREMCSKICNVCNKHTCSKCRTSIHPIGTVCWVCKDRLIGITTTLSHINAITNTNESYDTAAAVSAPTPCVQYSQYHNAIDVPVHAEDNYDEIKEDFNVNDNEIEAPYAIPGDDDYNNSDVSVISMNAVEKQREPAGAAYDDEEEKSVVAVDHEDVVAVDHEVLAVHHEDVLAVDFLNIGGQDGVVGEIIPECQYFEDDESGLDEDVLDRVDQQLRIALEVIIHHESFRNFLTFSPFRMRYTQGRLLHHLTVPGVLTILIS